MKILTLYPSVLVTAQPQKTMDEFTYSINVESDKVSLLKFKTVMNPVEVKLKI